MARFGWRFPTEGDRPIVDVRGLTTLTGPAARVPHALKPAFDEDRRIALMPNEYRYTIAATLPDLSGMNKDTIRKAVQRCRSQLAREYEQLHNAPPRWHLLIQSNPTEGYRLDPEIIVLTAHQRF